MPEQYKKRYVVLLWSAEPSQTYHLLCPAFSHVSTTSVPLWVPTHQQSALTSGGVVRVIVRGFHLSAQRHRPR